MGSGAQDGTPDKGLKMADSGHGNPVRSSHATSQPGFSDFPGPPDPRIGSVPYLNAIPLTCGIEKEVLFAPPSQLAVMLQNEMLDAALVSITEALLHPGYVILESAAIASDGPVLSVFLATQIPLNEVKVVHCDPASLTSINLLRVILHAKGLHPEFRPLQDYEQAIDLDAVLLIGDAAIAFRQQQPPHQLLDLGQAWQDLTGLPFVYAVWAIRESQASPQLLNKLWLAKEQGLQQLARLIEEDHRFDLAFRQSYVGKAIKYEMGEAQKQGINAFIEQLRRLLQAPLFDPKYVANQGVC